MNLSGNMVGALAYDSRNGLCTFEYSPQWLETGIEISPRHMPLGRKKYIFPNLSRDTYKGLPSVFADTLPDDFGNAVINAWLVRQGRSPSSFTALERLLYIGERGMGALEYSPGLERSSTKQLPLEMESLVTMAQQVVDQRSQISSELSEGDDSFLNDIFQVGTSAGGARPKAVIGINKGRNHIVSGQLELPKGYEHYLLKFDGVAESSRQQQTFGDPQGFGRMEYAYYLMAIDAGIDMTPCELLHENGRAHFMTKRFDRLQASNGEQKIHYQSLCSMDHADYKQPGSYSYEQLFSLMRYLRLPRAQAMQMFRRMAFNIIARNHDDHSKNFGFILSPEGGWQIAPAFDVAYSYKKDSPWVNNHQLSLNGKRDQFVKADLLQIASRFEKEARLIIEETQDVVANWKRYAAEAEVDEVFANEIAANHRLVL